MRMDDRLDTIVHHTFLSVYYTFLSVFKILKEYKRCLTTLHEGENTCALQIYQTTKTIPISY